MTRKIIAYVRVSDTKQLDGVSLDAQKAKILAYAQINSEEIAAVESDEGMSGKRADNRKGLLRAIETVCKEKGCLVVYSLSRLSRSVKDILEISEKLEKAGADLVSLSERIDTTSAAGRMVFQMLAVLSQFEREQLAERTKGALDYKKSRNEKTGGNIPYGFDCEDGIHLTENPTEQKVISDIIHLRNSGLRLQEIANQLQQQRILTKTGKNVWTPAMIRSLILRHSDKKAA